MNFQNVSARAILTRDHRVTTIGNCNSLWSPSYGCCAWILPGKGGFSLLLITVNMWWPWLEQEIQSLGLTLLKQKNWNNKDVSRFSKIWILQRGTLSDPPRRTSTTTMEITISDICIRYLIFPSIFPSFRSDSTKIDESTMEFRDTNDYYGWSRIRIHVFACTVQNVPISCLAQIIIITNYIKWWNGFSAFSINSIN